MTAIIILIFTIIAAAQLWVAWHTSPDCIGARGERKTAEILRSHLPAGYIVVNNIYLPLPDGTTTQIDHVVVSRYGIFVIETKTYSGWIFGDEKSAQWMQTKYRKKSRFQNPLRQNYRHVCALADCLGIPRTLCKSLVVFSDFCEFKTQMPPNVARQSTVVDCILSYSEIVIKEKDVSAVASVVSEWSDSVDEARRNSHVENLRKRHSAASAAGQPPACPYCGKQMVLRRNRKTGEAFFGCPAYPDCKGIIKIAQTTPFWENGRPAIRRTTVPAV